MSGEAHNDAGENDEGVEASANDPLAGRLIAGKYRVIRLVARGGMGRIYLAEQEPLGRSVALKVLDARYVQSDQDPEFQKRFLLEAATCARLTHPNTVKVYDYGRIEGIAEETYFMVMEFIDGRTLRHALKDYGYFPAGRALRVTREIARSLREAHRLGIVHRDLKPSNVMLVPSDEGESVKVLDFGIAKVIRDDQSDLTVGGRFLGSPRYMSPEVIKHTDVDARSDIYSLGILLYEMLCGRPPFASEKSVATMMAHLHDAVPSLKDRTGVDVAFAVETIARRCLEKDARLRFQNVDELIAAIEQVSREFSLEVSNPMGVRIGLSNTPQPSGVFEASHTSTSFPSSTSTGGTPVNWQVQSQVSARAQANTERWKLISFISLISMIVILAALLWRRETAQPPPVVPVVARPYSAPPPVEPQAPAPPSYVTPQASVVIVTQPNGVEVLEGSRILGNTPLTLPIDPAALAGHSRTLQLRLEGFQGQSIELGPVPAGTVIQRTLSRPTAPKIMPKARPSVGSDIRTAR